MSIKAIKEEFTKTQLIDGREKILFIDAEPELGKKNEDVTHVLYLLQDGETLVVWFRSEKEGEVKWAIEDPDVTPTRAMAEAHYDKLKWELFNKHDTATRKLDEASFDREGLRKAVRYFYDLQKLRIQSGNRDSDQDKPAVLEDEDKDFFGRQSLGLEALEKSTLSEIGWMLSKVPIFTEWLRDQKGCGPTMAGVIVAEIDITKCETPSALWAYAGLAVNNETGRAIKREKKVKSNWNPFLKAKIVWVLAGCFIKCKSPWTKFYYNYKTRKENQMVKVCMLCDGLGALIKEKKGAREITVPATPDVKGASTCYNCDGKKHNVLWGRGKAHRDMAAKRYMMKMFLLELWTTWRELEGLPITTPYSEAKLDMKHGDHAVSNQKPNGVQRASVRKKPKARKRAAIGQHP